MWNAVVDVSVVVGGCCMSPAPDWCWGRGRAGGQGGNPIYTLGRGQQPPANRIAKQQISPNNQHEIETDLYQTTNKILSFSSKVGKEIIKSITFFIILSPILSCQADQIRKENWCKKRLVSPHQAQAVTRSSGCLLPDPGLIVPHYQAAALSLVTWPPLTGGSVEGGAETV